MIDNYLVRHPFLSFPLSTLSSCPSWLHPLSRSSPSGAPLSAYLTLYSLQMQPKIYSVSPRFLSPLSTFDDSLSFFSRFHMLPSPSDSVFLAILSIPESTCRSNAHKKDLCETNKQSVWRSRLGERNAPESDLFLHNDEDT